MSNQEERKRETNTLILGIVLGASFTAGLMLSIYTFMWLGGSCGY